MAASTDIWAHENRNAESPQPFSIFEKYLKITRFESAEDELLAQCSIPVDESDLLTVPITLQQHEDSICSADDLLAFDESILQTLCGDSDFSDTLSEFSGFSMSQGSRRKKKRSECWNRHSVAVSPGEGEIPTNSDLNGRKVSSPSLINHKTIFAQHESSKTHSDDTTTRSNEAEGNLHSNHNAHCNHSGHSKESAHSSHSAHSDHSAHSNHSRHSNESCHNKRSGHNNRSSHSKESGHSKERGHTRRSDHSKEHSHTRRSDHSKERGHTRRSDHSTHTALSNQSNRINKSGRHKTQNMEEASAKHLWTEQLILPEVSGSRRQSSSRKDSNRSAGSRSHDSRRTKHHRKDLKYARVPTAVQDDDEGSLGRNMRAVPHMGYWELRT